MTLAEMKVIWYLQEFGNTEATDFLRFIQDDMSLSETECRTLLENLVKAKKICRIVHTKLRPPQIYFSRRTRLDDVIKGEATPEIITAGSIQ